MDELFTLYKEKLLDYLQDDREASINHLSTLVHELRSRNLSFENLLHIHYSVIDQITLGVDTDETARLSDYALCFLFQVMIQYRIQPSSSSCIFPLYERLQQQLDKTFNQLDTYETILKNIDTSILVYDPEDFISFVNINMGKTLKMPRQQLLGKNIDQVLKTAGHAHGLLRLLHKICHDFIHHCYSKNMYEYIDEEQRYFHILGSLTDTGEILIHMRDLTEFKKMEESVFQNEKLAMLGKMAAGVAHEIRNPLTSVRGFIQLLQNDLIQMGKDEYVKIILSELDRVNLIIQEFLSVSKMSSPKKKFTQMRDILREVVLLCQSEAILRNCEIVSDIPDVLPSLMIDGKQMKQVLLNIVKNAFDAIDQKQGKIVIRADVESGNWLRIIIRDNGKGMDHETLSHLFEPFYTTKEKGTGLGLSMCYRIVENHNGLIYADSRLGEGTTFTVKLPLRDYTREAMVLA